MFEIVLWNNCGSCFSAVVCLFDADCVISGSVSGVCRYIMIDAGLMFPDFDELGVQKVLPDTTFIRRWRDKIEAVIITHGHEDHIGALPWVVPALDPKTPIYATGFTMQLIVKRLKEYGLHPGSRCKQISMKSRFMAGPFEVEPIRVTHSIPDCCGLVLRCHDGTIFHTGDWKIDESPVDGKVFDRVALERLAKEGVTLMMSDSTNVLSEGRTTSESDVAEALLRRISAAKGRVITTQFASNVHRLGSVQAAAAASGRKVAFLGLSLRTYFDAAFKDGQAPFDPSLLVKSEDIDLYAPQDLVLVTTGSQAEPRAALNLASFGGSRTLKLTPDDLLLYSAKMIPGNETRVVRMMNRIAELGPTIVMGRGDNLHTSGHAYRDELEEALRLVKPQHFLPIHGEFAFMKHHELIGKSTGIRHTTVIKNGEMLGVAPLRNGRVLSSGFSVLGKHKLKLMYNDGERAFGTAADLCVDERLHIAQEGIVIASIELYNKLSDDAPRRQKENAGSSGGLIGRVRIITRCLWVDSGKLVDLLHKAADVALASCPANTSLVTVERTVGTVLRRVVQKFSNHRPDVIVIAVERSKAPSDRRRDPTDSPVRDKATGDRSRAAVDNIRQDLAASNSGSKVVEPLSTGEDQTREDIMTDRVVTGRPVPADEAAHHSAQGLRTIEHSAAGMDEFSTVSDPSTCYDVAKVSPVGNLGAAGSLDEPAASGSVVADLSAGETTQTQATSDNESDDGMGELSDGPSVTKRQRWKTPEIWVLFQVRSRMEQQFEATRQKKALWEVVATSLAEQGVNRTPDQCKYMWTSLLKKHAKLKAEAEPGRKPDKVWPHYAAIERFLSAKGEDSIRSNSSGSDDTSDVATTGDGRTSRPVTSEETASNKPKRRASKSKDQDVAGAGKELTRV